MRTNLRFWLGRLPNLQFARGVPLLQLSPNQYGILAVLTAYAVPLVLAATVPAGLLSTQIGTIVKLVRVLMLGPVVPGLSLIASRWHDDRKAMTGKKRIDVFNLVPWFILGFLLLAALLSFGVIRADLTPPSGD